MTGFFISYEYSFHGKCIKSFYFFTCKTFLMSKKKKKDANQWQQTVYQVLSHQFVTPVLVFTAWTCSISIWRVVKCLRNDVLQSADYQHWKVATWISLKRLRLVISSLVIKINANHSQTSFIQHLFLKRLPKYHVMSSKWRWESFIPVLGSILGSFFFSQQLIFNKTM